MHECVCVRVRRERKYDVKGNWVAFFPQERQKKVRYQRDGIFRGIKMVKALSHSCFFFIAVLRVWRDQTVCVFARKIAGVRESGNKIFYIKLWLKVSPFCCRILAH